MAFNRLLTDPQRCDMDGVFPRPRVSVHAEIDALRKAPRASGGILYIARVGRSGNVGLARPCEDCQAALLAAGVKRVVYTIDDYNFGVMRPHREDD